MTGKIADRKKGGSLISRMFSELVYIKEFLQVRQH
jgi:hypothetical protein